MSQTFISLLTVILGLGIIIVVHELGHLLAAKRAGVRVEKFSLGFGPTLFTKQIGETIYQIALVPFGGFVKLTGEELETEVLNDPKSLNKCSKTGRLAIFSGGSVINIFLGFIFLVFFFSLGEHIPKYFFDTMIGGVEKNSLAAMEGLLPYDKITHVNGKKVSSWEEIATLIMHTDKKVKIELLRNNERIEKEIFSTTQKEGFGIIPFISTELGEVLANSSASKAGLQEGDIITKINEKEVQQWSELVEIIQANPEKKLFLTFERNGKWLQTMVMPKKELRDGKMIGVIGIRPKMVIKRCSFIESLTKGFKETLNWIKLSYVMLWQLISKQVSVKYVSGPIGIIHLIYTFKAEFSLLLKLLGIISINLAVINLLPFPVLDGGHIMFLGIETILKRPIKKQTKMLIQQIAITILVLFILLVSYNDILRVFGK